MELSQGFELWMEELGVMFLQNQKKIDLTDEEYYLCGHSLIDLSLLCHRLGWGWEAWVLGQFYGAFSGCNWRKSDKLLSLNNFPVDQQLKNND